jgi:ABC-type Fe3+/spermidine/putrescine transport system ATPase subunit
VALARALVFPPQVLLLDEPLSNLDAQLREEIRRELKLLQQRLGITVLFVTHDQIEALSMSDRIAIMRAGQFEQVGKPEEVYYQPSTSFVRDFLGKTFLLPGKVSLITEHGVNVQMQEAGSAELVIARNSKPEAPDGFACVGQPVTVAIRPEEIVLWEAVPNGRSNIVPAHLQAAQFLGDRYEYTVALGSETRVLTSAESRHLKVGEKVFLELKSEELSLWPSQV